MPNWTENEVRFISKNKSSLTKLKKKLEGKEKLRELPSGKWTTVKNVFDFNKIIPMPKALIGTTAPTPMETKEDKNKAMALKIRYGHSNWYDWSCENWGTKWNSVDAERTEDGESVFYNFRTAWDCPREIVDAIGDKIPSDVKIDYWVCQHEFEDGEEQII